MDKKQIRKEVRRKRKALDENQYLEMSKKIEAQLFSSFSFPDCIGIYVSYSHEVNTLPIIQELLKQNKTVCVPLIKDERMMDFYEIHSLDDLESGYMGILEPKKTCKINNEIECMITPLVAFNARNERIGQGGGYYDTYFEKYQCKKIGLAFSFQQYDFISEKYDIPLDVIVTENYINYLSKSKKCL